MDRIKDYLETFFKHEGLRKLIPKHKLKLQITKHILYIWVFLFIIPIFYYGLKLKGIRGLLSLLVPFVAFCCILIIMVFYFAIKQIINGKTSQQIDAKLLGLVIMFFTPFLTALFLWVYYSSFHVFLYYLIYCVIALPLFIIFYRNLFKLFFVFDQLISIIKLLNKSFFIMLSLIPLLLVVIFLSVFSQDLWQIIGDINSSRFFGGIFLLVLPVVFYSISFLRDISSRIIETTISINIEEIINRVKEIPDIDGGIKNSLISQEDWERIYESLKWRDIKSIYQNNDFLKKR